VQKEKNMSERRDFLKQLAVVPAGAMLIPMLTASAEEAACAESVIGKLPENVIYTKEHPGVWKGKEGSHVPTVQVEKGAGGLTLKVENKHGMAEDHYIVRHSVVSEKGEVLGAKTFSYKDKPVSTHEVKATAGEHVFVLAFCNKHDLWIAHVKLEA
jgi:superoxide reductase